MKTSKLNRDRTEFRAANGIAAWWAKDGAWHIALPCPDPNPANGLRTGGFQWTGTPYNTREEAIEAIANAKPLFA
jgi:hypothetical protein